MEKESKFYLLKLIPPRPSFAMDMNQAEREIMLQHTVYWKDLMNKGFVVVYGPVLDPAGTYGLGIIKVTSQEQVNTFIEDDPASALGKYEVYPIQAIVPEN